MGFVMAVGNNAGQGQMQTEAAVEPTQRFSALWSRCGGRDIDAAWDVPDRGYRQPGRAYHNWDHIAAMLAGLDRVRGEAEFEGVDFDAIELAIFFHDVVYDARAKDNEAQSAALFRRAAAGIASAMIDHVAEMILATATHATSDDPSTRLLLDLDLAVLASDLDAYDRYVAAVRQEYAFVSDEQWRVGRAVVLERFLERMILFQTRPFGQKLENAARANLQRELAGLTA
jgi:predicted metal-dependent HD superfamily phosphohydrolase